MLKLLGITQKQEKHWVGYVEMDEEYSRFMVPVDGGPGVLSDYCHFKKSEFRDYLHFAGMIGKYDVFAILTRTPVEIKELSVEEIKRAIQGRPDLTVGTQIQHL